jgi:hypothetical protein
VPHCEVPNNRITPSRTFSQHNLTCDLLAVADPNHNGLHVAGHNDVGCGSPVVKIPFSGARAFINLREKRAKGKGQDSKKLAQGSHRSGSPGLHMHQN